MYFTLWHPSDVVIGRIGGLLHEEQSDPLKQLVARHCSHSQVEEQPVQYRDRNVVQRAKFK